MEFEWVNIESVDDSVVRKFDSGNHAFNNFLYNDAKKWSSCGEAVTYVFADKDEIALSNISRIYGFVAINTMGLLYRETDSNKYLHCCEIRLFAIAEQLKRRYSQDAEWSDIIFKVLLQNLYEMSTRTIGFKGIFLNANDEGINLYKRNGFQEITSFVEPQEDDKIETEKCTPLLLIIDDDTLYDIFM